MQELALALSAHLLPKSNAYHDIWLTDLETGLRRACGGDEAQEVESLYGKAYLPRKFKIALALTHDNCVDMYTPDLGLLAICEGERIVGYNFLVGGSFGMIPSNKKTFPALGKRMAFVPVDEVVGVAEAVIKVQRDHGDRRDRNRARLKYLVADWGLEKFKATVEEYYGRTLADPHPDDVCGVDDHLGWHEQGDGRFFYGLNVENGRILDRDGLLLKTALREVCHTCQPGIRLTPQQSILLTHVASQDRAGIERILRRHGVKLLEEISNARRWSMACVGLPTCPLTITESERVLPGVIDQLEAELARLGLAGEEFTIRMTGCPNGCARPYNADVGLSGRAVGKYAVYLGGRLLGDRLGFLYRDLVPLEEIVPLLTVVLTYFKHERQAAESFGDFCFRKGAQSLARWSERFAHVEAQHDAASSSPGATGPRAD
jgi:sulfite reductase (ferredoxin)